MGGVMEKIKVIDEHPNKIHDGMELFLVTGKQLTNAGAFLKGETFLTGFQKNMMCLFNDQDMLELLTARFCEAKVMNVE